MTDPREGTPTVPTSQASMPSTAAPPIQAIQHSMSRLKDIRMQAFMADSDPDETGRRWKTWKNELLTTFQYFHISNVQDGVDALHIYGGEQIRELIETQNIPTPASAENPDEYEKIIARTRKDQKAKARMKAYADLKQQTKPLRLNIGDHALVK